MEAADMNLPGYRFHKLTGKRKGTYSVTVTGNWRITFAFRQGNAYGVNLEDYHPLMATRTRKPTHPGAILREDILPELGMSQAELARRLAAHRVRDRPREARPFR